ncbi:hypothetical protein K469DRAFT_705224 [Zopfia rhizophila CBS 207.26]|uniref:Uncharacterized protein n=1 Tax=Zopfia rhizophila CBS 207.26 TaxID=1314779 RepID=A0A6A6E913_9PEZI|nr:hypothetical protein K469DRAFT_705224 [Zopfia rhizophila CBS 207.26]
MRGLGGANFRGLPPRSPRREWDLSSLREIIGDYYGTIQDCKKLLEENSNFRTDRNFAYNIEWNLVIQPKVNQLKRRLESHNSKILILLKPLELTLLTDIHNDLAERIDAVHRSVLHLQGLLIPDVEQALYEQGQVPPISLSVPEDIQRKFLAAAEKTRPQVRFPGSFPLQEGADAFVWHFENSTKSFLGGNFLSDRSPPPANYLSLLKCLWIMDRLLESDDLARARDDRYSQWPGYIAQLREDLCMECQRFTAPSMQRLIAPDMSIPRHHDEYKIWQEEDIAEYISPHHETYMEEILKMPMPSPSPSVQKDLRVLRIDASKYRLVESVEAANNPSSHRKEFKMDVDLKSVNLTPIYATPTSRPKALEVLINNSSMQSNPTFLELKYLLRLQHVLTGYKVYERYDQAMVKVSFFVSSQSTAIEEHGRLQLWLPEPVRSSANTGSPTPSETQIANPSGVPAMSVRSQQNVASITSTMQTIRLRDGSGSRQGSRSSITTNGDNGRSTPQSPFSLSARKIRSSYQSMASTSSLHSTKSKGRTPSMMTTSSSMSRSTVTSVTTISTGSGKAHLHEKPAKPLLVMFLKSRDKGKLAIAAVEIDDKTMIKRERCECLTSNSNCRISCVERGDGYLLAQRWDADESLASWNLARVGMHQRNELPADAWNDLKRISIKFESMEERYRFAGSPCSCKPKLQHDLSRCLLDGHQGVFGVVKRIGSVRLHNYNQERERATKRNMVLDALPEDELDP